MKRLRLGACAFVLTLIVFSWISQASPTKRVAFVVGTNDGGPGRVQLRYATSDAESVARVLERLGGLQREDRIVLRAPTAEELRVGFAEFARRIAEERNQGSRVEALFYYSGHSNDSALLLGDETFGYMELRSVFNELDADVRVAILDSCASGALTRIKGGRKRPPLSLDESARIEGSAILTSASATEAAQESDQLGGSFFTHYLVSGLRGAADADNDRRITLTEAYRFAYQETLRRTEQTQLGAQHANYEFRLAGTGDLVLTDVRRTDSVLELEEDLDGQLFIRDSEGKLVVEVNKLPDRPIALGLEAGTYFVTLSQPVRLLGGEFQMTKDSRVTLRPEDLRKLERERVVRRGETGQLEEVEVYYGLEGRDYVNQDFCLTFVPGFGTCALPQPGKPVVTNAELAVIGWSDIVDGGAHGIIGSVATGRVRGFLGSGLFSLNRGRLDGVQLTGAWGSTLGDADAVQLSGALALIGGSLNGLQAAPGFALVSGNTDGAQLAGGVSITSGDFDGAQVTGMTSIAGGSLNGSQASGLASIASDSVDGAQLAGLLNVSGGPVTGAQVGVVNIAWGPVSGSQVGVINVAQRYDSGAPIGLLNFVKDGQLHLDFWASDIFLSNVGVRFGSKNVYTLVSFGTQPELDGSQSRSGLTMGVGANFEVARSTWIAIDGSITGIRFDDENGRRVDDYLPDRPDLTQLRTMVGYDLGPASLFAGASFNVFIGDSSGRERPGLAVAPSRVFESGSRAVRLWPGFFAGLQF